MHPTGYKTQ